MTHASLPLRPGAGATPITWSGREGLLAIRARLHDWATGHAAIRAAIAFGSTERADRTADDWSDVDLLFVVDDATPWLGDLSWTDDIGPSWLRFVHPAPLAGVSVVQVLFEGGYDADLIPVGPDDVPILCQPDVNREVFGAGARAIVDRDGSGARLIAPAAVPSVGPPSAAEFDEVVAQFLYQTVWATKRLRRGERWRAHDDVDDYMRDRMLRMLEWHGLLRGRAPVFPDARRFERWVAEDVAQALPATFADYSDAGIARALSAGLRLFSDIGREVAAANGFTYPDRVALLIERWVAARLREGGLAPP